MHEDAPRDESPAGPGADSLRLLRRAGYRAMPWKNGGGITHEIARMPEGGDGFDWRLSMARIERAGPFSDFTGYRRTMLLLQGEGFVLRSPGLPDRVFRPGSGAQDFDGALPIQCDLPGGACTDLNLMVRDSMAATSRVEQVDATLTLHARAVLILFALQGAFRISAGGQTADLAAWDTLIATRVGQVVLQPIPGKPSPARMFIADVG